MSLTAETSTAEIIERGTASNQDGPFTFSWERHADGTVIWTAQDRDGRTASGTLVKLGVREHVHGITYSVSDYTFVIAPGLVVEPCGYCSGTGYRPGFAHVDGSRCWPCSYSGISRKVRATSFAEIEAVVTRRIKARERYAAKREAERQAERAKMEAWRKAHAELVAMAEREIEANRDMLAMDLAHKVLSSKASEKQIAFFRDVHTRLNEEEEKRARRRASAADVPAGRREIVGTIIKCEYREGRRMYYGGPIIGGGFKWTIKSDDGYVLWGSVPDSLGEVEKGMRVRFWATLEPSSDDPKFGFAKRPTKAEIISE